jgi:hypothetical protein
MEMEMEMEDHGRSWKVMEGSWLPAWAGLIGLPGLIGLANWG